MYSLTLFKNAYDNRTDKSMNLNTWEDLVDLLRGLSEQKRKGKEDAVLISPAVYLPGTTRSNKNVTEWGKWCAVDVDEYKGEIYDIIDHFHGFNTVLYSTASSTHTQIKFRIVFDLARRLRADELRHFWYSVNCWLEDLGDPQTKDSSRMYYVPGLYEGANNFFYYTDGRPLDVDYLLKKYPYVERTGNSFLDKLPENVRKEVIEHRKGALTNTDITWTGYLDCPFVPNKMVMEYKSISGTGWYHGLYRIMVAIASNAIRDKYPIRADQIATLCRQIDAESGGWYKNRPLEREADSAIQWAYANSFDF